MTFSSKDQALEAVIGGLSRVAQAVVAIPVEGRTRALAAAESSYRQTARNWGYTEVEIQEWTSTIMSRLRAEVAAQELGEQKNNDDPSLATPSSSLSVQSGTRSLSCPSSATVADRPPGSLLRLQGQQIQHY